MRILKVLCHSFAPDLLGAAEIALDCGANHGEFAALVSEHSPARVHSFEPDPRLFAQLPTLPRVTFHPLAVDGESGEFELPLGEKHCSSALYRERPAQTTIRVHKTSLDDFCRAQGIRKIDFIKIDIEGAELSMLERTSADLLRATTQITVEFHDFLRRDDTPRIVKIFARLEGLGFYGVRLSKFTWGDCLFLNRRVVPLTFRDRLSIHWSGRIVPGVGRFVGRQMKKGTRAMLRRRAV